jgi:hypothetical protein
MNETRLPSYAGHCLSAVEYRTVREEAFRSWRNVAGVPVTLISRLQGRLMPTHRQVDTAVSSEGRFLTHFPTGQFNPPVASITCS